jgi:hypothetical protein
LNTNADSTDARLVAKYSWEQLAEQVCLELESLTDGCITGALSSEEIQILTVAQMMSINSLARIYGRGDYGERAPTEATFTLQMRRIQSAFTGLNAAIAERRRDKSVQARYCEVQIAARKAWFDRWDAAFSGFPRVLSSIKSGAAERLHEYIRDDVGLEPEKYYDAVQMIASDGSDAREVPNPPARVRTALRRSQRREDLVARARYRQATPEEEDALQDSADVALEQMVRHDLERAGREVHLTEDQARVIEVRMEGLNLQSADAAEYLGWDPTRLENVRRSLAPDRRAGKALRQRLRPYVQQYAENKQEESKK